LLKSLIGKQGEKKEEHSRPFQIISSALDKPFGLSNHASLSIQSNCETSGMMTPGPYPTERRKSPIPIKAEGTPTKTAKDRVPQTNVLGTAEAIFSHVIVPSAEIARFSEGYFRHTESAQIWRKSRRFPRQPRDSVSATG
jgi:hypothetical protein